MSSRLPQKENDPDAFSSKNPSPAREKKDDEGETLGDLVLDTLTDGFDVPQRMLGCAWWSMTLPFRLLGKIIGIFFD